MAGEGRCVRRYAGVGAGAMGASLLLVAAAGLGACSSSKKSEPTAAVPGGGSTPVAATATADAHPRPEAVPTAAEQARAELQLGAPSGDADTERLSSISCASDVMTIRTTQHVIYAELPCDRALPDENVQPFVGKPVQVRAVPANPAKLYLDSSGAGHVEFTVGRVWVEPS